MCNLTQLEYLDLSCNLFVTVTDKYFAGLPPSISTIDLTFCRTDDANAADIAVDAFSTIPPKLQRLVLKSGYLKSSIFTVLDSLPASMTSLAELDLSDNKISFLPQAIPNLALKNLKVLRLSSNLLQSIGKRGLANFPALEKLDLNSNEISSIGKDDFDGLYSLISLSLSRNLIVDVDPGVLEPIPNLQEFYFRNNNYGDLESLIGGGGGEIRHLGVQGLPLTCLPANLFAKLPQLRWIYLNNSLPVFVDRGSFRNLDDEMSRNPPKSAMFADRVQKICDDVYEGMDSDPIRIIVRAHSGGVSQKLIGTLPSCYTRNGYNLKKVALGLICVESADTYDSGDGDDDDSAPAKDEL